MTPIEPSPLPAEATVLPGDDDGDRARRFRSGVGEPVAVVRAET